MLTAKDMIQLITALTGSLGFALYFNMRRQNLKWAALGGLLAWGVYLILQHLGMHEYLCGLLAAAVTTAYSEVLARVCRTPAIVFITVGTVPLIPGAALYRSFDALMRQNIPLAKAQGRYALLFAASMAAGIVLTTLLEKAGRSTFEKAPGGVK